MRAIDTPFRDFTSEEPVSDETFALYLRQFDYDRKPLNATIEEETDDGNHQQDPSSVRSQRVGPLRSRHG